MTARTRSCASSRTAARRSPTSSHPTPGTNISGLAAGPADVDGDGEYDDRDNCVSSSNPAQTDTDGDGAGDACDPCAGDAADDVDGDGICGDQDLCPSVPDALQEDADDDGIGNACDSCSDDAANDVDLDGVCGNFDVCPSIQDIDQLDTDSDEFGDACDVCPGVSNPDQLDTDGDLLGDACDPDDDNDTVADVTDCAPINATAFGIPVEVTNLEVAGASPTKLTLHTQSVGSGTHYQVVSGLLNRLKANQNFHENICWPAP